MTRLKLAILAIALLAAAPSGATNFEDQKAMLDAQIELVQKQKALQEALRSLGGASSFRLPSVVSVMNAGAGAIVRLQLPNGQVGHYRRGDMVQRGMVLTEIAPRQVVVTVVGPDRKGLPVVLEFASPAGLMPPQPHGQEPELSIMPDAPRVSVTVPAIEVIPAKAAVKPPAAKQVVPAIGAVGKAAR